jgi:RIO-like serine/threonine protein kinase
MIECIDSLYCEFCENIESYFSKSSDIITKKRNVIKISKFNKNKVVIKSFKIPNIINQFAYRFIRSSKAKRSYKNAIKLQELGIKTPKPICYVENFRPLLKESYYVCEFFEYDFEIRDVLNDKNFSEKDKILKEFVLFSYNIHQKGVYHIDYSPGNVLVKKDGDRFSFSIVDLNRMKFIDFSDELRFKNLSRFSASDKDTRFIAKEYALLANIDKDFAQDRLLFYHNKHQDYLSNKKRLKSMK